MRVLAATFVILVLLYIRWRLSQPETIIGSYLKNFDSSARRLKMIRDEADQDYELGKGGLDG